MKYEVRIVREHVVSHELSLIQLRIEASSLSKALEFILCELVRIQLTSPQRIIKHVYLREEAQGEQNTDSQWWELYFVINEKSNIEN